MKILAHKCKKCLSCIEVCPVQAILEKDETVVINKEICLECGCCASTCPHNAIIYE